MKTSKKLLSFFLAAVMLVSTCSVGFTAFAKSGTDGIWKDSTSASKTYDALNDLVDTYVPDLLNIEGVKDLLEGSLGMTVTDTTSISDVVAGVAPLLLGLLGGGDPASVIKTVDRNYSNASTQWYNVFLDDPDAPIDFYALYDICYSALASSDSKTKEYARDAYYGTGDKMGLRALLTQYVTAAENYDMDHDDGYNQTERLYSYINQSDLANVTTIADLATCRVNYKGTEYASVDDLMDFPEFSEIYVMMEASDYSSIGGQPPTKFSEMVFYVCIDEDSLLEQITDYLLSLVDISGVSFSDMASGTVNHNLELMIGFLFYCGYTQQDITDAQISDKELEKIIADLITIDAKNNTSRVQDYVNGGKPGYPEFTAGTIIGKFLISLTYNTASINALVDGEYNGKTRADVLNDSDNYVIKALYSSMTTYSQDTRSIAYAFQMVFEGKNVASKLEKFKYSDYAIPDELAVSMLNNLINGYVNDFLDPSTSIGAVIAIALDSLLESNVDIYDLLKDIFLRLYEEPVETIFELLPILTVLLDELLVPMVFNEPGDSQYNALYDSFCIEDGLLVSYTQTAGSEIGIGSLSFDLNKLLPDLMHWLLADKSYTFTYYNVTEDGDTYTYGDTTTGTYNLNKTPVITNIYVADKALQYAKISDIEGAGGEVVKELASFFTTAVDTYVSAHSEDFKGMDDDGKPYNRGINNLFVAIPMVLDQMGKDFIAKYGITSDWSYSDHKIKTVETTSKYNNVVKDVYSNETVTNFKNLAAGGSSAEDILESFVDIFINNWINALLDLLNDATATNNKLTKQIPLVKGLLDAVGGLGEKSILSDILNGVFELDYNNDASFAFKVNDPKTGYVGFSTKSAYFLLSNIGQLIGIITSIDTSKTNVLDVKYTPAAASKNYNKASASSSTAKTSKSSSLLGGLDGMLSDILAKSSINNFNLNSTAGIFSGVISLLSYLIGSDNENDMLKLLDSYLYELNEQDKKSTDTSKKKIYTEKGLTNLVVQTYALLENILEYYITEQDAVGINVFYDSNKDIYSSNASGLNVYNILTAALNGLISPHAVSTHVTNTSAAGKLASLSSWRDAIKTGSANSGKTGATNISINWGFSAGDTNKFYTSMAQSLGVITDLLDVLLVDAGYYDSVFYPILKSIDSAQTVNLGVYKKGTVKNGTTALLSILTPLGNLLDAFYKAPATVLANLLKGVSIVLNKELNNIAKGLFAPLYKEIQGVSKILGTSVSSLSPSLAKDDAWFTAILKLIVHDTSNDEKNGNSDLTADELKTVNTVMDLLKGNFTLTDKVLIDWLNDLISSVGIKIPASFFKDIAKCKNADAVLEYLLRFVVKIVTSDNIIGILKGLVTDSSLKQLFDMIGNLTYDDLLNIINAVLAKTTDPTDVYWTFLQYVQEKTTGFYYPKRITAAEADNAVGQLDDVVDSVFALLSGLGVVDKDNLKDLVSGLLYTNKNLTSLAKALYGAIEPYAEYLDYAGIDVTKNGVAKALTDKSYGKTYSSAANAIKKAKSWNKLGSVNWGFTDGTAKAEQGFINALAAIFRPFDDVLAILLAGDSLAIGSVLTDLINGLSSGEPGDGIYFKNGKLYIEVEGSDKNSKTSTICLDINSVINQLADLKIYGGNGYESAVVPLLEALGCSNLKTYKQYKNNYSKAKDNILLDVLNPLFGFVDDVLEAPFDTLSAALPNVAYFIDNNGVAQVVNNLLSPITSLLPVLKDNGLDVNKIIKLFTGGESLNSLITGMLGVNIHLDLNDLNKCEIQKLVVPLLNSLLEDYGITLPNIDWGVLASHGKLKVVKSAARNSEGKYTREMIVANQGETLIAVLRYVGDVLIDNMGSIKTLLKGIKSISKDVMGIINVVLNQVSTSTPDKLIQAIFYFLQEEPTNAFWDYRNYKTKENTFTYPENMNLDFLTSLSPMLDGLVGGIADLNKLIGDALFKDDLITSMVTGIGKAIDGVKINDDTNLTELLAMTDIDYSTKTFAKLLNDSSYGATYASNASIIGGASSWSKVNASALKWGVTDRESFFNALCAALRPFYGVLDVLLNAGSLGLFDIVYIPGSNGYTSVIVPLLEAFSAYNIKTQYQYREDISKKYDSLLLNVLNPLWDKVEDIFNAPLQTLGSMLPNLALFIANDGLLQLIENLFGPISALIDAIEPVVNLNVLLDKLFDMLDFDLNKTLSKAGLNMKLNINLYDLTAMLKPLIGADNLVPLINQVLGIIKIGGKPLGIDLMSVDWLELASHGTVLRAPSQAATYGARVFVEGDSSETLIAVLRYLVDTINYKDNFSVISALIASLLGDDASSAITDVIDQVLGLLQGDTDDVISQLCELLETFS